MALPETTLSNPLLDASYLSFLEVYTQVRPPGKTEVDRAAISLSQADGSPSPDILRRHQPTDTPILACLGRAKVDDAVSKEYLCGVSELVKQHEKALTEFLSTLSANETPSLPLLPISKVSQDADLNLRFKDALYWLNVVDRVVMASKKNGWERWEGGWFSRRLSLIPVQGEYLLCTTDVCLMFKDMMYSRFIIPLYCILDQKRSHLTQKLAEYEAWGAGVLKDLGNESYNILKGIEILSQTEIIRREETILDGEKQHQTMLDKYTEKELKAGGSGAHTERLAAYLRSFRSSRDLAEAFGFLKLWGHPYVNPYAGCQSVQELAKQSLKLKMSDCLKLEWSFCHLYCRGYLRKHGRWPRLKFIASKDKEETKLQRLYESSHPSLAFGFTQYDPSDWQWTSFEEHLAFDEGEDILSLVVDKSISHKREFYDSTWGGRLSYTPPRSPTSTRVMEELISRPEVDLRNIVEIVSNKKIPYSWKIVSVCPKEREMKIDPRMFSMMVLEMRLFFVLTEHNIAKGVFSSLPEQTMTMNRQELLSLFLQSTRPAPGTWVRAVLGVDFSRWNIAWREETVHPIGRRMDQMYGKPGVFSCVHTFFEESMCLLRLPEYPPDHLSKSNRHAPPESRSLWYGHKGGFEGIAQKLWTACTIALIHMSLWKLGLSYKIMGQGDNQVCILEVFIPSHLKEEEIKDHIRNLVEQAALSIAEVSKSVGQVVKPEECIYSTCFLTYGKEMILRGAYLPTSLKYISRMFPSTTSDAPSLYEMVSSISSGASGATERNDWSYPTYYLAKFMEGITLSRELKRSLFHGDSLKEEAHHIMGMSDTPSPRDSYAELMSLLLAVPANLGGFPITTIPEMMYRGHSDPLSSSLLHLVMLQSIPHVERYKKVLMKGWLFKKVPELVGLVQDPYALPLTGSSPPSSSVASVTSTILQQVTRNRQFREMLDRTTTRDKDELIGWLQSCRPFYPKIAHDLYKCSLIGVRDAFSRRFSNTRTLINMSRKSDINVSLVSLNSDLSFIRGVFKHMSLAWKVDSASLSFTRSQLYRVAVLLRQTWLGGVHLEGVTVAHPLSVGTLFWMPSSQPLPSATSRIVISGLTSNSFDCLTSRGEVAPYMGSSTSDKSVAKWVRPVDSSPPLKDVLKILSIRNMMGIDDTDFYRSATALAQSRSCIPTAEIDPLSRVKTGGTVHHRHTTRDDAKGTFWSSCFNWPSHITISTNLSGDLGAKDYPFSYQEALISCSTLLCWAYSTKNLEPPWGVCLDVDLSLMDEVGDHVIQSTSYEPANKVPPNNYYASVMAIRLSSRASQSARLNLTSLPTSWTHRTSSVEAALSTIFLYNFRSGNPLTTRYGHTIGIPQSKRVIDLPEGSIVQTYQAIEGLSLALWMKVGLSVSLMCTATSRPASRLFRDMIDLEARRGIPSLAGTLREINGGNPLYGLGIGIGREGESDALARWMHVSISRALESYPPGPFTLYERGTASMSSVLSSWLGILACIECMSGDRDRFKAGKLLAVLTRRALAGPEEHSRVRLLAIIVKAGNLTPFFRVDITSPEETLRRLRGSSLPSEVQEWGRIRRVYVPPTELPPCNGGTALLSLLRPTLSREDLLLSWSTRLSNVPAPAERWSPLASLHSGIRKVLLIGVGSGNIGGALPMEWEVTGIELASMLQTLGHSFTNYKPPGLSPTFYLHPLSWSTSGDITQEDVQEKVKALLIHERFDLCILDVEGIDNHVRAHIRCELASTGVPTYCKVLLRQEDVTPALESWTAYRGHSDVIWTTKSYPMREFIFGKSEAPMLVYNSVLEPYHGVISVPIPQNEDYQVSGYPEYNPGSDCALLTGHLSHSTKRSTSGRALRALFPYLHKSDVEEMPTLSLHHISLSLLANRCPRRRVRALQRLVEEEILREGWERELVSGLRW